ncbi:MnuA family membrane nuclease [Mycoplasmopsis cynos]|uniref:Membrane nuclease MnuA n=1 Tax=Mycoplasmopsis cynos TaxID=171284 RepID=A0A449AJE4_9BACT|nr:nuclease [Mycoplasmopsis cynos]TQC54905.1 nuclease [Mycoplasmopsis cynos]VEU65099.1 Membrane nuclease MnuA [Mycoplasmopsis cynos]
MKKKKNYYLVLIIMFITLGAIGYGGYVAYNKIVNASETKQDNNSTTNIKNQSQNTLPELDLATWNIQNFGSSSPKEGTKVQAVAELISNQDLKFVSVQEVSYENWSAIEKVIRVLKERYNKNYSFAKSPLKLFSTSRPKSKESYAIIYDPTIFEEIDNKGLDKFEGKDIEFTRPLWISHWGVRNSSTKFWIINGHLDSPSNNKKEKEKANPTINGYKWTQQGEQEVKEFLDIKNAFESIKKNYDNSQIDEAIIFNGDTNIKKEHFNYANKYYEDLGYETGYHKQGNLTEHFLTSMSKNGYVNPYDKFIIFDPNNSVDQVEPNKYKFDLYNVFKNNVLDRQKYLSIFSKEKGKESLKNIKDNDIVKKISDHTFAKIKLKVHK